MKTYSKNIYKIVEAINNLHKEWIGGSINDIAATLPEGIGFDCDTPIYGGANGDGGDTDLHRCYFTCENDQVRVYINTELQTNPGYFEPVTNVELYNCDIWMDDVKVAESVDIRPESGRVEFKVTCVIYNEVLKKNHIDECEGSDSVILEGMAHNIEHAILLASSVTGIDFKKATFNPISFAASDCYECYANSALMTFFLRVNKVCSNSMYTIHNYE